MRALAKKPEHRWGDAGEFRAAILGLRDSGAYVEPAAEPAAGARAAPRRARAGGAGTVLSIAVHGAGACAAASLATARARARAAGIPAAARTAADAADARAAGVRLEGRLARVAEAAAAVGRGASAAREARAQDPPQGRGAGRDAPGGGARGVDGGTARSAASRRSVGWRRSTSSRRRTSCGSRSRASSSSSASSRTRAGSGSTASRCRGSSSAERCLPKARPRSLAPAIPSGQRIESVALRLASSHVLAGPHAGAVRRAAEDRVAVEETIGRLAPAEREMIPDVLPTVIALAERVGVARDHAARPRRRRERHVGGVARAAPRRAARRSRRHADAGARAPHRAPRASAARTIAELGERRRVLAVAAREREPRPAEPSARSLKLRSSGLGSAMSDLNECDAGGPRDQPVDRARGGCGGGSEAAVASLAFSSCAVSLSSWLCWHSPARASRPRRRAETASSRRPRSAPRLADSAAKAAASTDSSPAPLPLMARPEVVRGLYVNRWAALGDRMWQLIDVAKRTEVNALVIDVKDDRGFLLYRSGVPLAQRDRRRHQPADDARSACARSSTRCARTTSSRSRGSWWRRTRCSRKRSRSGR